MRNRRYHFKSVYSADRSAEEVWLRMTDVESWPRIWKYFRSVKIAGGSGELCTGSVVECRVGIWFYHLSLTITVIDIDPHCGLSVNCGGDLSGSGRWELSRDGEFLKSIFDWDVDTNHWLLNFIGIIPFGRRLLEHNHRVVMDEGFRSFLGA